MDQVVLVLTSLFCVDTSGVLTPLPLCSSGLSREADRVILTRCQQDGANQNTFQAISSLLGNKTPSEVILSALLASKGSVWMKFSACFFCCLQVFSRFQDLMGLFQTAARHSSSEEAPPPGDGDC